MAKIYVITADSLPVYDGWGWDDYWSAGDWMDWHKKMEKAFGIDEANRRFINAYQNAGTGAASFDWRTFNSDFKKYAKDNNFYDALFDGIAGLIVKPISTGTSVINSITGGDWLKHVKYIVIVIVVLALIVIYFKYIKPSVA